MTKKIKISDVYSRFPYFIQCSQCNNIVEGSSKDEVIKKVNEQNYTYDYEGNKVFCSHCFWED